MEEPHGDATESSTETRPASRRRFLKLTGAGSVAALAGCSEGGNGGGNGDGNGGGNGDGNGDGNGGGNGGGNGDGNGDGNGGGNGADVWQPSQSVRYIVPYDEGGGTDVYARGIVEQLIDSAGQQIQIDNIPGAGGLNGFGQLMTANPDGHTILGSATPLEVAPQLLEDPGFDQRDARGIGVFGQSAWCLVVNEQYQDEVETFDDVIQKYNSGEWQNIGVQSPGSSQDVIVLLAKYELDEYDWQWEQRVTYTGTGPISQAVASNEVPAGIGTDAGTQSVVDGGSIYPVVSFVSAGTDVYPDIDSVTDLGYPEIDFVGGLSRGMYAPPETDDEIIEGWTTALEQAVNDDRTSQWTEETGNPTFYEGPEAANARIDDAFAAYDELNIIELVEQNSQ